VPQKLKQESFKLLLDDLLRYKTRRTHRRVVFTVLPGHGIIIVEKWIPGKSPFQVILEYFDAGFLDTENLIPQVLLAYTPDDEGRMKLTTP
jgi:hypothetical protein